MNTLFRAACAASAALAMIACGNSNNASELTPEGVGPVRLGAQIGELPRQVAGLYDTIEVKHQKAYYDEFEGEEIPAYDTYQFLAGGTPVLTTTLNEGETEIGFLNVVSPEITYKKLHAGMRITEALAAGARLYTWGHIASCGFSAWLTIDDSPVRAWFDFSYGNGFSQSGYQKLCEHGYYDEGGYFDLSAEDFQPEAVIKGLQICR